MQLCMHVLVLTAYFCLVYTLKRTEVSRFVCITLNCFIFGLQQLQIYFRYNPLLKNQVRQHQDFREQSFIQLVCFVCLIGAFLPLRYFALPIYLIYGGALWAVYFKSNQCLMTLAQATLRFCSQLVLTLLTALAFQVSLY
jgi:hypothetical protein